MCGCNNPTGAICKNGKLLLDTVQIMYTQYYNLISYLIYQTACCNWNTITFLYRLLLSAPDIFVFFNKF